MFSDVSIAIRGIFVQYLLPLLYSRFIDRGRASRYNLSGGEEELISTAKVGEGGGVSKRGNTVRDKYGDDYFRRIGKKGGNALKDKRGSEYYRSIAQKGGRANVVKYGPGHFSERGKKGGNTTRERRGSDF